MVLPSQREIELETAVRIRDKQLRQLKDEISFLRRFLSQQPEPSKTDPVAFPPAVLSLLVPQIRAAAVAGGASNTSSSSTTTALTQRVKMLQEENDELYEALKRGETGKLKEEVRALRRLATRLQGALSESNGIVNTLQSELERSRSAFLSAQQTATAYSNRNGSLSIRGASAAATAATAATSPERSIPTGPRAQKKRRLSQSRDTAVAADTAESRHRSPPPPESRPRTGKDERGRSPPAGPRSTRRERSRERGGRERDRDWDMSREIDRERDRNRDRDRNRESERDRDRDRERIRERERERDKDRARERDRDRIHGRDRERERGRDDRVEEDRESSRSHGRDDDRGRSASPLPAEPRRRRRRGGRNRHGGGGGGGGGGGSGGGGGIADLNGKHRGLVERMGL